MPPKAKSKSPKPRAPLSASKKAAAAKKSRITRCKKKCDESGGEKVKRKYAPGEREAAAVRAKVNLAPWRNFFAQYRVDHEAEYEEKGRYAALRSAASKEWAKMSPSRKGAFADKE